MLYTRNNTKILLVSLIASSTSLLATNLPGIASQSQPKFEQKPANSQVAPIKIAASITRQNNFVYEFRGCRKFADRIDCIFKITYTGQGNANGFYIRNARIFSGFDGNQYDSSSQTVAGRDSVNMISQQPIKAIVSFPWSPGLRKISTLEMETNYTDSPIQIGRGR
ncbi:MULTISPECIES: hypothetical protein [unclassified Chamaesiphon]|uniref:hypothetical protein n=1 Tax=unclassified Chamaesiphon TaxID=2620921 RepID=UPI00286A7BB3|nr:MULTISPECIES: hypothetical protein [unclassified Chamaesiphon]